MNQTLSFISYKFKMDSWLLESITEIQIEHVALLDTLQGPVGMNQKAKLIHRLLYQGYNM